MHISAHTFQSKDFTCIPSPGNLNIKTVPFYWHVKGQKRKAYAALELQNSSEDENVLAKCMTVN